MKNLNNYILEKFKINKDISLSAEMQNEEIIDDIKKILTDYISKNFDFIDICKVKIIDGNIYFDVLDDGTELSVEDGEKICSEVYKILKQKNLIVDKYDIYYLNDTSTIRVHPNWKMTKTEFDNK